MACSTRYYRHHHGTPVSYMIHHNTVGVIRLQRPLKVICLFFNSRNKELETSEGGTYSNESHIGGERANNSLRYVTGMPPLGQDSSDLRQSSIGDDSNTIIISAAQMYRQGVEKHGRSELLKSSKCEERA